MVCLAAGKIKGRKRTLDINDKLEITASEDFSLIKNINEGENKYFLYFKCTYKARR